MTDSPHIIANALTEWLQSLKTPIFTKELMTGLSFGNGMNCHFIDTYLAMVEMLINYDIDSERKSKCLHLPNEVFTRAVETCAVESIGSGVFDYRFFKSVNWQLSEGRG